MWRGVLEFLSSLANALSLLWSNIILPIYEKFGKTIVSGLFRHLRQVWNAATDFFGWIIDVFKGIIRSAKGLLNFFNGIFTLNFDKCLSGIEDMIGGVCDSVWGAVKGAVNIIIDALNALWSGFYTALKTIVDGLGGIAEAAGDLLGEDWGFSLPDEPPTIPRLASGGLVKAPMLAVVGDNPNASRDPEVVAPLSKLGQMMNESSGDRTLAEILSYMKMIYEVCVNVRDIEAQSDRDREEYIFRTVVNKSSAYKRTHGGRSAL